MATTVSIGCLIAAILAVTSAYPSGAPDDACGTLVPQHPNTTTTGMPPYKIRITPAVYKPGSQITGSIFSPSMSHFRGFLIQARAPKANNATASVGQFINPVKIAHTVCGEGEKQSLTHNNNTNKTSVDFTWQAPAEYGGDIVFYLTIVDSYDPSRYWLGITSDTVLDCSLHTSTSGCAELQTETKTHKKEQKQGMALLFEKASEKQKSIY